jgi:hypothetical protein
MSDLDDVTDRLGKQIREYRTRTFGQFLADEARDLGLIFVLTLLMVALASGSEVYRPISYVLGGIVGLIFLVHVLKWLVRAEKVQVFQHGLRQIVRGKKRDLAWRHVTDVRTSFVNRHHRTGVTKEYLLRLEGTGDRELVFTQEYPDVIELANVVRSAMAADRT